MCSHTSRAGAGSGASPGASAAPGHPDGRDARVVLYLGAVSSNGDPDTAGEAPGARAKVVFEDITAAAVVFGQHGEHLKVVQRELGVRAHVRGNEVTLLGDEHDVALGKTLLEQLYGMAKRGQPLGPDDLSRAVHVLRQNGGADLRDVFSDTVLVSPRARRIAPKSLAQKQYIEAIRQCDMVFGIGPAGTGKTYLAMAMAIRALLDKSVKRIVLTRPAVEAGEKLGFLPGSMIEKVNPYLRPLYDALQDMMDLDRSQQLIERGIIEVAPLAFMRGRTLNDSFVILDEAQNTTSEQMKMFLTRLGYDSKAVITGDITQIDLLDGRRSGLLEARSLLAHIEGIRFCTFTEVDVVRHPLVAAIIKAYDLAAQRRDPQP
ncbi:MAG: PhoH family protein [Deltaproteobacteria bacterium]|nr:PhoH family protein [Deltaproteobacteria bacterium]